MSDQGSNQTTAKTPQFRPGDIVRVRQDAREWAMAWRGWTFPVYSVQRSITDTYRFGMPVASKSDHCGFDCTVLLGKDYFGIECSHTFAEKDLEAVEESAHE